MIDGDGYFGTRSDRYGTLKHSLLSSSKEFVDWLFETIKENLDIKGGAVYKNKAKKMLVL